MQQLESQIKDLKSRLEQAKDELYRAELRMESLEREEDGIKQECKTLGLNPDDLPAQIESLEKEITKELNRVDVILRGVGAINERI